MSVYIKGMEMPTNCNACELAELVDISDGLAYGCNALKEMIPNDRVRLPNCPLVYVPPHGDLIDRDKLEKDIDKYIGGEESRSRFHHWVQVQRAVIHKSEEAHT